LASDVQFLSRANAFDGERRITLTKEGVLRIAGGGGETRLPVHDIGLIELSAESSFASGTSYVCRIYAKRAWFPVLTIKSKRYRGPNDFVDQRGEYRQFLAALHDQVVANAWPVKTQISAGPAAVMLGLTGYAHWAILIWGAAFFACVFALGLIDHAFMAEISFGVASLVTLAYLASKISRLRDAYGPWPYDARAIPPALLPEPLGVN
jgi:hypothetical protein